VRETLDPHYGKIMEGLGGDLSPKLFEACVQDLLRKPYPGLVPIHGGQDAGMDAAIADGEGEAYPVVITTAQDVIGNLTRSLESYLAADGRRRRCLLRKARVRWSEPGCRPFRTIGKSHCVVGRSLWTRRYVFSIRAEMTTLVRKR